MAENKTEEEILETDTVNEEASSAEEETKEAGNEASAGETEAKEAEEKADKKAEKKEKKAKKKKDKKDEQIAEFDNFRKRTEKEKAQMFEVGAKSIIEKILPVIDNFERGLASIPEEEAGSAFADGMNMIYKQLMNELEQAGVAPIEAVGEEFDPEYHNAVMQVENDELESGTVAQELQKGYTYRDSVVRHSMVAVVQ